MLCKSQGLAATVDLCLQMCPMVPAPRKKTLVLMSGQENERTSGDITMVFSQSSVVSPIGLPF